MGGDILPSPFTSQQDGEIPYIHFIKDYLFGEFRELKKRMGKNYPRVFIILGNDDRRLEESTMLEGDDEGLWHYCHLRRLQWCEYSVYGYSFVPPTPFRLKDWERYDVTRYVRPGCIAPEKGFFTVVVQGEEFLTSIGQDLEKLCPDEDLSRSIFLFHSPPHHSKLDRAALDGHRIDDIQVDMHVGSVAIQRFILSRQPLVTLHGHIHESSRLTGCWRDQLKNTISFNASHDGPELALIRFSPSCPGNATRQLI